MFSRIVRRSRVCNSFRILLPTCRRKSTAGESQRFPNSEAEAPSRLGDYNLDYHTILRKVKEANTQRFQLVFTVTVTLAIWISAVWGERIKKYFVGETTAIAKQTLGNEAIKMQTQELAMAVVQTVLNDKDITSQAAAFAREVAAVPETRDALLQLTNYVLQHPDSLKEVTKLFKKMIEDLSSDAETIAQFGNLFAAAAQEPAFVASVKLLLVQLGKDPELFSLLVTLLTAVAADPSVVQTTQNLVKSSTQTVLSDHQIINRSKEFVADVMGDDMLQKEGGDALWKSVSHALKPGLTRIVGCALIAASIGVAKVLLSPF